MSASDSNSQKVSPLLRFANSLATGLVFLAALCVASTPATAQKPQRIVSLNICTDELLVALAPKQRIAALSFLARDPRSSAIVDIAKTLPVASGSAEQTLGFNPDLVLAGTFTTRGTVNLLKRIGVRVETIPIARSFDDVFRNLEQLGEVLEEQERAKKIITSMKERLDKLRPVPPANPKMRRAAIFYQVGSIASGSGTLQDDILRAAGFRNIAAENGLKGFAPFPLETLILADPDFVVLSERVFRFQTPVAANLRHPAFRHAMGKNGFVMIPERLTTCGTPKTLEIVERLAAARRKQNQQRSKK